MGKLYKDYFSYVNNLKITESVVSNMIFESKLDFIPKFTIAIPTYNRPDLLKEAIDSALNQSEFSDYDVIVVDNNPERNCETEKLLNLYKDTKVSYYKNSENLGMCGNWNRLYILATGQWVVMLHDDDILLPNYLSTMSILVNNLDGYSAIFPTYNYFKGEYVNEPDSIININKDTCEIWHINENEFLYDNILGAPIGMCFKKIDFIQSGGFSNCYYPSLDYDFYIKISHWFKICKLIDYEPLCSYRFDVNEGMKKDIILSNIQNDFKMKKALSNKFSYPVNLLWTLYFVEFSFYYLNRACNAFEYNDIDIETELNNLGFRKNLFTKFMYKVFRRIKKKFFMRNKDFFYIKC